MPDRTGSRRCARDPQLHSRRYGWVQVLQLHHQRRLDGIHLQAWPAPAGMHVDVAPCTRRSNPSQSASTTSAGGCHRPPWRLAPVGPRRSPSATVPMTPGPPTPASTARPRHRVSLPAPDADPATRQLSQPQIDHHRGLTDSRFTAERGRCRSPPLPRLRDAQRGRLRRPPRGVRDLRGRDVVPVAPRTDDPLRLLSRRLVALRFVAQGGADVPVHTRAPCPSCTPSRPAAPARPSGQATWCAADRDTAGPRPRHDRLVPPPQRPSPASNRNRPKSHLVCRLHRLSPCFQLNSA